MDSPSMTVREVAIYLNVDEKTVYRLAQRGELPGFKVAGTWRFKRQDIDTWIERQKKRIAKKMMKVMRNKARPASRVSSQQRITKPSAENVKVRWLPTRRR